MNFIKPLFRNLIILVLLCASPAMAAEVLSVPNGTTLIVLRHADRDGDMLSRDGIARAEALPAALSDMEIDAIYSPGMQRNLDTAAPLAKALGLEVIRRPGPGIARKLITEGAGKTIVWVGNKGNLNGIWDDIGAPEPRPLNYGDLFIVTTGSDGTPKVAHRHFGATGN